MITTATPTPSDLAAFDGPLLLGFLIREPILHGGEPILNMVVGERVPPADLGTADRVRGLLAAGSILPVYDRGDGYTWTGFLPAEDIADAS